jgi:hypothetical protein
MCAFMPGINLVVINKYHLVLVMVPFPLAGIHLQIHQK